MVARNAIDHTKGYKVPTLSFEGEPDEAICKLRYELGL